MPSHNCIIISSMFSFQGTIEFLLRNSMKFLFRGTSVNLFGFFKWWRLAGSNRWPPACKAGALPAELNPHIPIHKYQLNAQRSGFKLVRTRSGGPRTCFPAGKPRRLQQSTGLLPSAAFRVHFGVPAFKARSSRSWLLFNSVQKWWAKMDSNHRPHDYQSCALASWAIGPYWISSLLDVGGD